MPERNGEHIIHQLRRKWQRNYLASSLLLTLAGSALLTVLLYIFLGSDWWVIIPVFVIAATFVYWQRPFRRISAEDITSFLNRSYPQLEESSQLLLQPRESLSLLQQLQQDKVQTAIRNIPVPSTMYAPLKKSGLILVAVAAVCYGGLFAGNAWKAGNEQQASKQQSPASKPAEIIPAGIKDISVSITPPSYTGLKKREQGQLTLKVEEGSNVSWRIKTTYSVDSLHLLFNNKEKIALKRDASDSNQWTLQLNITEPGFYQVELPGISSALYTLEVIHDQPADIRIITPQQYTTIDPGNKPVSNLRVHLSDDYGITRAQIVATKASGKGESVSFKEQQLGFNTQPSGQKQLELNRLLDLASMGMQGGDELYFYVKVTDNHGQESRSDMYFISLPDTSELLSMSGMESGVNQVPEYFRSQRQIIIDTEKLLKEQSGISRDTFNGRSNDLGIEQKLLRLRYGKFLGEENESGGEHSPDDGHDHGAEPEYGDVQSLIDQYAHKHDNAEDATFLEPEQKKQLKAVLTEMWNSELKLRTLAPADALPYQYKALRLLKDLQQKSRAYVSKTSIKMPPLKPEKRLTGNLDKITPAGDPVKQAKQDQAGEQLRDALGILEKLRQKQQPTAGEQATLYAAEKAISERAMAEPARFLPALNSIRSVTKRPLSVTKQEIADVQHALLEIIRTSTTLPQKTNSRKGQLSDLYFKNLEQQR